jgi:hypothetical protein
MIELQEADGRENVVSAVEVLSGSRVREFTWEADGLSDSEEIYQKLFYVKRKSITILKESGLDFRQGQGICRT